MNVRCTFCFSLSKSSSVSVISPTRRRRPRRDCRWVRGLTRRRLRDRGTHKPAHAAPGPAGVTRGFSNVTGQQIAPRLTRAFRNGFIWPASIPGMARHTIATKLYAKCHANCASCAAEPVVRSDQRPVPQIERRPLYRRLRIRLEYRRLGRFAENVAEAAHTAPPRCGVAAVAVFADQWAMEIELAAGRSFPLQRRFGAATTHLPQRFLAARSTIA